MGLAQCQKKKKQIRARKPNLKIVRHNNLLLVEKYMNKKCMYEASLETFIKCCQPESQYKLVGRGIIRVANYVQRQP